MRPSSPHRFLLRTLVSVACLAAIAGCGDKSDAYFQGYVEGDYVYIASAQPGRLATLSVTRGQQINTGDPLFTLESTRETAARQEAAHQLDAAIAQLEDISSGKRPPEVDVTRAQLAQAEASSRKTSAQRVRDEAQYRAGGISLAQLDDSRAQAQSDAARVRELRAQLEVAALPARLDQRRAQAAQVDVARAALAQADWTLAQTRLTSPDQARVFDTLFRVGEWVSAGSPVVSLLPPGNIKLRFFVAEPVLGKLAVGQRGSVRCDGCGEPIPVEITYLSTQAEYTPPVIYSRENRSKLTYMVEARPSIQDAPRLHPGQPVEVSLP